MTLIDDTCDGCGSRFDPMGDPLLTKHPEIGPYAVFCATCEGKRHAIPPTPDALDVESLREDIRSVLDQYNPDPTAEWWAEKADLLLAALEEARAEVQVEGNTTSLALEVNEQLRHALTAAESARGAAEGAIERVRELAEKWEGYAEACRLGMNNSAGETSEPRLLWSVAADRVFDALGDYAAAPVTTDATEGEA